MRILRRGIVHVAYNHRRIRSAAVYVQSFVELGAVRRQFQCPAHFSSLRIFFVRDQPASIPMRGYFLPSSIIGFLEFPSIRVENNLMAMVVGKIDLGFLECDVQRISGTDQVLHPLAIFLILTAPVSSAAPPIGRPPARAREGETDSHVPASTTRPSTVRVSGILHTLSRIITFVQIQLPKASKSLPLFQLALLRPGRWLCGSGLWLRLRERAGRGLRQKVIRANRTGGSKKSAKHCDCDLLVVQYLLPPLLCHRLDVKFH
jgi:hypothetical protein